MLQRSFQLDVGRFDRETRFLQSGCNIAFDNRTEKLAFFVGVGFQRDAVFSKLIGQFAIFLRLVLAKLSKSLTMLFDV